MKCMVCKIEEIEKAVVFVPEVQDDENLGVPFSGKLRIVLVCLGCSQGIQFDFSETKVFP